MRRRLPWWFRRSSLYLARKVPCHAVALTIPRLGLGQLDRCLGSTQGNLLPTRAHAWRDPSRAQQRKERAGEASAYQCAWDGHPGRYGASPVAGSSSVSWTATTSEARTKVRPRPSTGATSSQSPSWEVPRPTKLFIHASASSTMTSRVCPLLRTIRSVTASRLLGAGWTGRFERALRHRLASSA